MTRLLTPEEIAAIYKEHNWMLFNHEITRINAVNEKQAALTEQETLKKVGEYLDKKWESAAEIVLTRELINQLKNGQMPGEK